MVYFTLAGTCARRSSGTLSKAAAVTIAGFAYEKYWRRSLQGLRVSLQETHDFVTPTEYPCTTPLQGTARPWRTMGALATTLHISSSS